MEKVLPPELLGPIACFSLVWGVASTLLWLYLVFRVIQALEGLARAHADLASAVHRIGELLPQRKSESPAEPEAGDWRAQPPSPRASPEQNPLDLS